MKRVDNSAQTLQPPYWFYLGLQSVLTSFTPFLTRFTPSLLLKTHDPGPIKPPLSAQNGE